MLYEDKFAEFQKAISKAKTDGDTHLVIAKPWVIGDTYQEIIESLSRLAEAGIGLHIAER